MPRTTSTAVKKPSDARNSRSRGDSARRALYMRRSRVPETSVTSAARIPPMISGPIQNVRCVHGISELYLEPVHRIGRAAPDITHGLRRFTLSRRNAAPRGPWLLRPRLPGLAEARSFRVKAKGV